MAMTGILSICSSRSSCSAMDIMQQGISSLLRQINRLSDVAFNERNNIYPGNFIFHFQQRLYDEIHSLLVIPSLSSLHSYFIENMERPRFTKINITTHQQHSQHIASSLINHLLQSTANQLRQKEVESKQTEFLTHQMMQAEEHTVGQAVAREPLGGTLPEDSSAVSHAYDPKRPMSAKMGRRVVRLGSGQEGRDKKGNKKNCNRFCWGSKTVQVALVRHSSVRRCNFQKQNGEKCFPLTCTVQKEDSFDREEQLIAEMRLKKIQQSEFERSKTRFFKTVANEEQKTDKANKRFIQLMGSKAYYYNNRGEAVELQQPQTGLRKGGASKLGSRAGTAKVLVQGGSSKRVQTGHQKKEESIWVQFKAKHSNFRSSLQAQILEDKEQALFFKSNQCQYKVIS